MIELELAGSVEVDPLYDLAVTAVADGERVCFCAKESGIYRSHDAGASWDRVSTTQATAIEVSPNYAEDQTVIAGAIGAICRSVDGGDSWEVAPLGSPPPLVSCISFSPAFHVDSEVMVGTVDDGVFQSVDGGQTWVPRNTGLLVGHILTISYSRDYARDRLVLLGTETDLFRSVNGGLSWRDFPLSADGAAVVGIATWGDVILATTEDGLLYRSPDCGVTWVDGGTIRPGVAPIMIAAHETDDGRPVGTLVTSDSVCTFAPGENLLGEVEVEHLHAPVTLAAVAAQGGRRHVLLGLDDGSTLMRILG